MSGNLNPRCEIVDPDTGDQCERYVGHGRPHVARIGESRQHFWEGEKRPITLIESLRILEESFVVDGLSGTAYKIRTAIRALDDAWHLLIEARELLEEGCMDHESFMAVRGNPERWFESCEHLVERVDSTRDRDWSK